MESLKTHYFVSKKALFLTVLAGSIFSLFYIFSGYKNYSPINKIDYYCYDTLVKFFPSKPSQQVILIDIDDYSLSALGQWPWPRYKLAALINKIADHEPAAIGLDIVLPEPDRTAMINIQKTFKQDFGLNIGFKGVPFELMDNDGYLAQILQKTGTVGAQYFYFDHHTLKSDCSKFYYSITTDLEQELNLPEAKGMMCNTPIIENGLVQKGFINNQVDDDGLLRKIPLLIKYNNKIYPNISLATLMKSMGTNRAFIKKNRLGFFIQVDSLTIPVSRNGNAFLRFKKPGNHHRAISAVNILNNSVKPINIKNKIIFIASSAVGLSDMHNTIFNPNLAGLEIHATAMENFLDKKIILIPDWSKKFIMILSFFTTILMSILFLSLTGPVILSISTAVYMAILLFASIVVFARYGAFVSPGQPVVLAGLLFSYLTFVRFAVEKKKAYLWYKMISNIQQITLETMVTMLETRDPETGSHIKRTQHYATAIAEYLYENKLFKDVVDRNYINLLYISVPLHDIGKVAIPDRILMKPGELDFQENKLMKEHSAYGEEIISKATAKIKGENFLKIAEEVAGTHHEKWNGQGYPKQLSGNEIPLSGRIMAIADVYDALISKRIYKSAISHEDALEIIKKESAVSFDPVLVSAFVAIEKKVEQIALQFKEN